MRKLFALAVVLTAFVACSKAKRSAWSDEMVLYFGNAAAQPTDPPRKHWTRSEEELFLKRLGHADLTVLGVVSSVGTFSKHEDPRQVTLTFLPQRVFYGSLEGKVDKNKELVLELGEQVLDFRRAVRVGRYLPGKRYLLLLKEKPAPPASGPEGEGWEASLWRPPAKAKPTFRWALYRPEKKLLEQVRELYQLLRTTKPKK